MSDAVIKDHLEDIENRKQHEMMLQRIEDANRKNAQQYESKRKELENTIEQCDAMLEKLNKEKERLEQLLEEKKQQSEPLQEK